MSFVIPIFSKLLGLEMSVVDNLLEVGDQRRSRPCLALKQQDFHEVAKIQWNPCYLGVVGLDLGNWIMK